MKSIMLRMDATGSISQESIQPGTGIDYAARYERMRDRADPEGHSMVYMTMDHRALSSHTSNISELMTLADSLESLNESVTELMVEGGMSPENLVRFEKLANYIAGPLGQDPIVLTDAEGIISTESLGSRARVAYQSIQNNLRSLVNSVSQYFLRYRSLTGSVARQLKIELADLKKVRYNDPIDVKTTLTMSAICDESGQFDLSVASEALRAFADEVKWVVNTLAPETISMLAAVGKWLDEMEVADDNTVNASFSKVMDIQPPLPLAAWPVVPRAGVKSYSVTKSTPTFDGNGFTALTPNVPPKVDTDYLTVALMGSDITYGDKNKRAVIISNDIVEVDNIDTVIDMVERALEILEFHDIFNLHSTRLVKELNGLMNAGQRLMQKASAAGDLSESSVAKLVLAIQAPQAISLRAQSPFRDVLYESVRVVTGVLGLAGSVKTALSSAE